MGSKKRVVVFINYRMSDTYEAAENLKNKLETTFENILVLKDTYHLLPGDLLPERTQELIRKSTLVLCPMVFYILS